MAAPLVLGGLPAPPMPRMCGSRRDGRTRSIRPGLLLAQLLLLPLAAHAQAVDPPGVNLRWDRCYGDGGVWNKTFACNTNVGTEQLVGSFDLAENLDRVVTAEIVMDLRSASSTLPAWWQMMNFGTCRRTALDLDPNLDISSSCMDWSVEPTGGGISLYSIGSQGPEHVRINASVAVPTPSDLTAGVEYFLFRLLISHEKTVGTGSCAGCDQPVCIFLSRVSLYRAQSSVAAIHLEKGANWSGSQHVTWQNGYPLDVHQVCETPGIPCPRRYTDFECVLSSPTANRGSTWGQVKAMFR